MFKQPPITLQKKSPQVKYRFTFEDNNNFWVILKKILQIWQVRKQNLSVE